MVPCHSRTLVRDIVSFVFCRVDKVIGGQPI